MAERKTQETKPQEEQKITLSMSELQEMIRAEVAKAKEAEPAQAQELTVLPAPPAKKVKVKLFKDNGQYSEPIFVSVNGERYIVPRGVEVEIPEYIAEVLERSMAEDQQTALMLEQLEQKFNEKTRATE